MTGTQHPFSEDELLAFVHGTASPDLVARIDEAQAQAPALTAEIALMTALKPALAGMPDATNAPGDLGWHRLEADIRRETRESNSAAGQAPTNGRLVMWKAAAVFFGIAALGQAVYLTTSPGEPVAGYQTATEGTADNVLVISFRPDATEADMRRLLQATNARFVDGPGASGLYRVTFETDDALAVGRIQLEAAGIIELLLDE